MRPGYSVSSVRSIYYLCTYVVSRFTGEANHVLPSQLSSTLVVHVVTMLVNLYNPSYQIFITSRIGAFIYEKNHYSVIDT